MKPPNEDGARHGADLLNSLTSLSFTQLPAEVNHFDVALGWLVEAGRLLRESIRTNNPKHIEAYNRHVKAARAHLAAWMKEALP